MSAERKNLAKALCDICNRTLNEVDSLDDGGALRHAAFLARDVASAVERNVLDNATIYKLFGTPGDWGYDTPLGDALYELYSKPSASVESPRPFNSDADEIAHLRAQRDQLQADMTAMVDRHRETTRRSLLHTDRFYDLACAKGWHDETADVAIAKIPERLALIHSEVSEALEEYRGGRNPARDALAADGKPEGLPSELADVVIRCFDLAGSLGIDLVAAIDRKHAYNATRSHRHGGKRC